MSAERKDDPQIDPKFLKEVQLPDVEKMTKRLNRQGFGKKFDWEDQFYLSLINVLAGKSVNALNLVMQWAKIETKFSDKIPSEEKEEFKTLINSKFDPIARTIATEIAEPAIEFWHKPLTMAFLNHI